LSYASSQGDTRPVGRKGLHPDAVAHTAAAGRRGRAAVERLAIRFPSLARRFAAWAFRLRRSRLRRALLVYFYRRAYAAYNRQDWELNTLLHEPDSFQLNPGDLPRIMPDAEPSYTGIEGYLRAQLRWVEVWRAPKVQFEDLVEAEPGTYVALIRFVGEGAGSGMRLDQPLADVHRIRAGRVVSQTMYWDRAAGLRATGLDPSRFGSRHGES
jgi:hypothetical protein